MNRQKEFMLALVSVIGGLAASGAAIITLNKEGTSPLFWIWVVAGASQLIVGGVRLALIPRASNEQ